MVLGKPLEALVSFRQAAYVQKRRTTRIGNVIPLTIQGSDAFRAPYLEHVSTLTVNCHGCRYQSKNEVVPGDTVYLEVQNSREGSTQSCLARVKAAQRLVTTDSRFEIAVELAAPGNIWGLLSPPEDWFSVEAPKAIEKGSTRREQPLTTEIEERVTPILNNESPRLSHLGGDDYPNAASSLSLGQLMDGFGKQVQILISHEATGVFLRERERLMGEFRTQLQNDATRTLESVIATSKEELTRRVLKELNEAHEAAARITYACSQKQIEQDMKKAAQSMLAHAEEVSRRVGDMTISAVAQLERTMEASRIKAVGNFLSNLRDQSAPLLEAAQIILQNLTASENNFRDQSQAGHQRFDIYVQQATDNSIAEAREKTLAMIVQYESDIAKRLVESHNELHETSVEVIAETTRSVRELSQSCGEIVQGQLQSLMSSAADDVTKVLKERTAQISRQFSDQLEGNTRSYLELIGESIAQIPKKIAIQSSD